MGARIAFEMGELGALVTARTRSALACGALEPIATRYEMISQSGCSFVVRVATNLIRKAAARKEQEKTRANPFLPYDERLYVADLSETHVCLLNKFNVADRHILMVTRAYEEQTDPLTLADFAALWRSLLELNGLAFYNGGRPAGSSQPHKHLQLVPFPLAPAGPPVPLEEHLLGKVRSKLPFALAVRQWQYDCERPLQAMAEFLLASYQQLRGELALAAGEPFNVLATRHWLAVVPRTHAKFQAIAVNSLGFAGTMFVRDRKTLQELKDIGPLTVLAQVGRAP